MAAKAGLTKSADIQVRAREIDFVTRFGKNWDALREILGIMRPIEKQPGTKLVASEAKLTLADGNIGEGEDIPYSNAQIIPVAYADIALEKYAKAVSVEAVDKWGAAVAVNRTDDAFLNELQGKVLDRFYTFLQTGSLTSTETTFQMAIAMAIGRVVDKFKKMRRDYSTPVVFVNTLDVYEYLGSASITIQTQNGIQYIRDFMGAGVIILSSELPRNKVIATLADNIVLYYVNPSNGDYQSLGLTYTVAGETPLIGFHAEGNYNTAVGESFALMGMALWAEYLDAIAVVTIGSTKTGVSIDKEEAYVKVGDDVTLTATTTPAGETVTWTSSDTSVATVSSGVVTGVSAGIAIIKASITTAAGTFTDEAKVIVTGSANP